MSTFTPKEKERIFIERTQDLWPQNWAGYLELVKHETWSKDELQDYNFKQRVKILTFAYENTEFYKKLYDDAGLKPQDIKTEEDWNAVPVVTKQMISEHSREIEVRDAVEKYGFVANTGGSTGKPLRVFRDKRHFWQAPFWRFYGWHVGRKCGCPFADVPIWGMDQAYLDRSLYRFTSDELKQRTINFWPIQYYYLSPYQEFAEQALNFVNETTKSPLVRFYAYAGAIDLFADYCLQNHLQIPNVAFVEVCASPVNQIIRDKVQKTFGCNVFDFYGSNEMGPMAVECMHSGEGHHLHVLSDLLHIELLSDNGAPVEGEDIGNTVVTSFTNRVFPFVRYDHGDRTHWINKSCECGLPFPCIAPVKGRVSDYLSTRSGMRLDGVGFNEIFDFYPEAVRQFQFRQSEDGVVSLLVVPNKEYSMYRDEINQVFSKLQQDFDGKIKFTLHYVESIAYEGGKMRYIIHE